MNRRSTEPYARWCKRTGGGRLPLLLDYDSQTLAGVFAPFRTPHIETRVADVLLAFGTYPPGIVLPEFDVFATRGTGDVVDVVGRPVVHVLAWTAWRAHGVIIFGTGRVCKPAPAITQSVTLPGTHAKETD